MVRPVDALNRSPLVPMLVHLYTASGAVLGLLMVHYAFRGNVEAVLWLFLVAMWVDGTDGFLARHFKVKERLPGIDGSLMDNIIDYLTYAFAPMVLLWENGFLPDGYWGPVIAAIPLLASTYQFCRSDAKTDDHFFLGFPSYWNIAAFYAIVCGLGPASTSVLLLICAVLVFVPIKYVYPSRTERYWWTNMASALVWLLLYAVITASLPATNNLLIGLSLLCVLHYVATSLWLTYQTWDQGRKSLQPVH
jgi:phosphatidylcholine synthase